MIFLLWAITFEPEMLESPSKAQKNLDYSLVSTKKLSQKIPSSSWHPGPVNFDKNGLNLLTYDVTHKKTEIQNFTIKKKSKQEDLTHLLRV